MTVTAVTGGWPSTGSAVEPADGSRSLRGDGGFVFTLPERAYGTLAPGPGRHESGAGDGFTFALPGVEPPAARSKRSIGFSNHSRSAGVLHFNVKGFSLLEMQEGEGADIRVRRIREREMRRPLFSISINKRF